MRIGRVTAVAAVVLAILAVEAPSAGAEPGDLDWTFRTCGLRQWSPPVSPSSTFAETLTQPDGKLLQVGLDDGGSLLHVTRLVASGAGIDRTYGTAGTAVVPVPGLFWIADAAVSANGKLVVAGHRADGQARGGTAIVRLTASGRADQAFGAGGIATSENSPPTGVVIQADSRIILWGGSTAPYLHRYLPNGEVDAAWIPPWPSGTDFVTAAMVAANGDLVVATGYESTDLHRFKPNGSPDATFSASFVFPGSDVTTNTVFFPSRLLELADGKILVVGALRVGVPNPFPDDSVAVVQLAPTGALVMGYGAGGFATVRVPWIPFRPVAALDAAGRLLVAGTFGNDPASSSLRLVRFTPAGAADPTFGDEGVAIADVGDLARVNGIAVRGKWILVGYEKGNQTANAGLARFRTDSTTLGAGYVLEANGALHPFFFGPSRLPCVTDGPRLPGLARGVTTVTNRGGLVLDGFGGLHPFSIGVRRAPARPIGGPYWPGWDIARGVAALPNGKGGYVLDGFGGIHRYRTGSNPPPPPLIGGPYWPGWDVARGIALLPNGKGGYVVDDYGAFHPFTVAGSPMPPPASGGIQPVIRNAVTGISILADGTGGYVSDLLGGAHGFRIGSHGQPPSLSPGPAGRFIAGRGVAFVAPRVGVG